MCIYIYIYIYETLTLGIIIDRNCAAYQPPVDFEKQVDLNGRLLEFSQRNHIIYNKFTLVIVRHKCRLLLCSLYKYYKYKEAGNNVATNII